MLREALSKCICGEQSFLYFVNERGRVGKIIITVIEVPLYICSKCGEQFSNGPDNIRPAKQVKEAVEMGIKKIRF